MKSIVQRLDFLAVPLHDEQCEIVTYNYDAEQSK